ncbi:SAYSvFN domain-containing protein 1-like [Saccoglossus kowalevskii]|uniref:SAYSvFN domain-containing protein 1-like n=1 Tax=Saccoglossus kowalevskii TaxID=10224 RepID=A0ABM0LZH3_SACKO|nr:PREDICTED: SAYSvFN domain-containing protein 1-like [Saccoglossus kowalevskii]
MSIESQLAEYRSRKAKEGRTDDCIDDPVDSHVKEYFSDQTAPGHVLCDNNQHETTPPSALNCHYIRFLQKHTRVLKFVLWFTLLVLFMVIEFAAVYIILSIFYVMYANLSSSGRRSGELSAYSVFNRNCERIDGTFTAEQFEKELRFGAGAVK